MRKALGGLAVLLLAGALHFHGAGWGGPDAERIPLVFGSGETVDAFVPAMRETHREIRDMQEYYGAPYDPDYDLGAAIAVREGGRERRVTRETVNALRAFLTRSAGADEQAVLVALSKMDPGRFDFNPHFFEYGGAYLYPLGAVFFAARAAGAIRLRADLSSYFGAPEELGRLYAVGRAFGAAGAVLAALVFYLVCLAVCGSPGYAVIPALLCAAAPAPAVWSHYLKPYSFCLLWIVAALGGALAHLRRPSAGRLAAAAAAAGLAAGSLLSGAVAFVPVAAAAVLAAGSLRRAARDAALAGLLFLAVYAAANPYALLSWREFAAEMRYVGAYWQGEGGPRALGFFLLHSLRTGMGVALWAAVGAAGIAAAARPRDREAFLCHAAVVPGLLLVGLRTGYWVHYALPLYPFLLLYPALILARTRRKTAVSLLLGAVLVYTVLYAGAHVRLFGGRNVRNAAGEEINRIVPRHARIGLSSPPAPWWCPPFRFLEYRLSFAGAGIPSGPSAPRYLIVSEYQWVRGAGRPRLVAELERAGYRRYALFERPAGLCGIRFRAAGTACRDWCHPNPRIEIWTREKPLSD